jgi:ABC-type polysaccharide/polyol phosphate export permease
VKNILFIALQDVRFQIRQGGTLVWLFIMPPIFFYFIGTVTGGFSSGVSGGQLTPLAVVAEDPGFLREQIDLRLRDNDFEPLWLEPSEVPQGDAKPERRLDFAPGLSARVMAGESVAAKFETSASALTRDFEEIRIQRSLYTVLADIVAAQARAEDLMSAADLAALNAEPRIWRLETEAAGQRRKIPTGFDQSIPGILVMFTLLVLLTSGASLLAVERRRGLLRRLAATPISRTELVAGKWGGRMALAVVQIATALAFGTWMFRMDWGPDIAMVMVVLLCWAAFCAAAGLLLGSLARTEAQAAGLGALTANVLAALGGCWWPIEVTPGWMQGLQNFLPTGWTMDALHKLISFGAGPASALPQVLILLLGTTVVTALAIRRFRYE